MPRSRKEGRNYGELGEHQQIGVFVLRGAEARKLQNGSVLASFARSLVDEIKMEAMGKPVVLAYPVLGRGGVGFTIFQPITTSYIAFDTWPELKGGAILVVCSCRPFDEEIVSALLAKTFNGIVQSGQIDVDLLTEGVLEWRESS